MDDIKADPFWSKVDRTAAGGCWTWTGRKNADGYGVFSWGRRNYRAHRHSVELTGVRIEPGMVVDHICRVRACVNPLHLRVVTRAQNSLENSLAPTALNALKTRCVRGHLLSGDNVRLKRKHDGTERVCRQCNAANVRAHRERKAALTGSPET